MAGFSDIISRIVNTSDLSEAKSIAAQARDNIFMYRVVISASIGDVNLAIAINKYIERMCAMFTVIVSGVNAIAKDNNEIKNIIKGISAESYDDLNRFSAENFGLFKSYNNLLAPYDSGIITNHSPRIGKFAKSTETETDIKDTKLGKIIVELGQSLESSEKGKDNKFYH